MKKIIRLTESDLARIVRRVIKEQSSSVPNEILLNYNSTLRNNQIMNIRGDLTYLNIAYSL